MTHTDRDAVAEVLREAYSQGQLDEDEFEERLDQAMRAKYGADLEPLTQDLGFSSNGRTSGPVSGAAKADGPIESTAVERVVAGVGHAGNYFFPIVTPLLLFLIGDQVSPYIRRQAMESLNFQLACLIGSVVSLLLIWLVVPAFMLLFIVLGWAILPAIGTIASLMGKDWRYPMPDRFRILKDD
ncbi:DUF1707 and DUF4870 domain-containing protein [Nocardiopsis lambiniae]|uniref:DUF1707 and DUF4870 domain-containing protein n=1 Tax=Nocardiopsis lambiniae TaxID=3075539 RepID=A0ABU2MEM7_9ACTN|nr:DUF1707 and DUF4870 domain-containing protein [Nocardiopsis sp. DSM 44743]MDT0331017.1 DUF1707 and DUF4870 domain-containing protein [Nocardiopsis sp. DSM 44743]